MMEPSTVYDRPIDPATSWMLTNIYGAGIFFKQDPLMANLPQNFFREEHGSNT